MHPVSQHDTCRLEPSERFEKLGTACSAHHFGILELRRSTQQLFWKATPDALGRRYADPVVGVGHIGSVGDVDFLLDLAHFVERADIANIGLF